MAARLALLSCLPVRVTPAFLRRARLRLVAGADTGDEADVWLSDLVETRSSAGLSYRRGVREWLRLKLAEEPATLDAVWTQVHLAHSPWLAERTRLEEELTWRLLRDPADPRIDACWRAVIEEMESGPNAEGVARWVVRAVPDLPSGALDHESGRRAYYGANLLLGDASVLGTEVQKFLDTGHFAFATRHLPRRRIHLGRVEEGLLLSSLAPITHGFELDIPATRPLWLQVSDGTIDATPQVLTLTGHEVVTFRAESDTVHFRLIDGSAYALGPETEQAQRPGNRAPRVEIGYDMERYGGVTRTQMTHVTGVLADLSGHRSQPLPEVADRKFISIDIDTFDECMKAIQPELVFVVHTEGDESLAVHLKFESMDDFLPDRVARRIEPLRKALEDRASLAEFLAFIEQDVEFQGRLHKLLADAKKSQSLAQEIADPGQWGEKPLYYAARSLSQSDEDTQAVQVWLRAWARQALARPSAFARRPAAAVNNLIVYIDQYLSARLSDVMHQPNFQKLEGSWRGLHYLVCNTETGELQKLRVLNISKHELGEALAQLPQENWDPAPIMKLIHDEEYGKFDGSPYSCLIGDFEFDHSPQDVAILEAMSKVAAASFSPFIAAASPALLQISSWQDFANARDLDSIFGLPEYAGWNSLRTSEDSRFLALALPRFLARLPFGPSTWPVEDFNFEEATRGDESADFVWANAAYVMATIVQRSFREYGWCTSIQGIESGGLVDNLPTHAFRTDSGELAMKCPTEIAITDRLESKLSGLGLMPLVHMKNTDYAAFFDAGTLHKWSGDGVSHSTHARLRATLPYVFAASQFSQAVQCVVRDKVGSFRSHEDISVWLTRWLETYVDTDPEQSSREALAKRPLFWADMQVEEIPNDRGHYQGTLSLTPRYNLPEVVPMRMLMKLPSGRA